MVNELGSMLVNEGSQRDNNFYPAVVAREAIKRKLEGVETLVNGLTLKERIEIENEFPIEYYEDFVGNFVKELGIIGLKTIFSVYQSHKIFDKKRAIEKQMVDSKAGEYGRQAAIVAVVGVGIVGAGIVGAYFSGIRLPGLK